MTTIVIPVAEIGKDKGEKKLKGRKIQKDFFLHREEGRIILSHIPSGGRILSFFRGLPFPHYELEYWGLSDRPFSLQEIRRVANRLREIRQFFPRSFEELKSWEFDSPDAIALRAVIVDIVAQIAES